MSSFAPASWAPLVLTRSSCSAGVSRELCLLLAPQPSTTPGEKHGVCTHCHGSRLKEAMYLGFSAQPGKQCTGVCLSSCHLYPTCLLFVPSETKQNKARKKKQTQNNQKSTAYISGCPGKRHFGESKFEDIYPQLFKPRNQGQAYFHSPSCEPGLGIIPQLPGKVWNLLAQSSSVFSSCPR